MSISAATRRELREFAEAVAAFCAYFELIPRIEWRAGGCALALLKSPPLKLASITGAVPPAQAELFLAALEGSGVPHAYLPFEGEAHGFRRAATVAAALEAELSFYGQVLGFEPAGVPVLELVR